MEGSQDNFGRQAGTGGIPLPRRRRAVIFALSLAAVLLAVLTPLHAREGHGGPRRVVDMEGRAVSVPSRVDRVVTIGGAPIINTFIFALGRGGTIVNGLPVTARNSRKDCCRFQDLFAPQLDRQPSIEERSGTAAIESLLMLRPDVVITSMSRYVSGISWTGIPVVCLNIRKEGDNMREIVRLLGKVYDREARALAYIRYYDSALARVRAKTRNIPDSKRVKVLYCNARSLTQSSPTADLWIETAGGISLGKGGIIASGTRSLSTEHILAWDPDVWIVSTPAEVNIVYGDTRFRGVKAVRNRRVAVVPTGALRWSHPTSELPLGILWAARLFYPDRFHGLNIEEETKKFYEVFFGCAMTDSHIREILGYPLK